MQVTFGLKVKKISNGLVGIKIHYSGFPNHLLNQI
jgi:hypothetical protein